MAKTRFVVLVFLAAALWLSGCAEIKVPEPNRVTVTLTARYSTTSWDDRVPSKLRFNLPVLILHRERDAAPATERTLALKIIGLAPGTTITMEARSRHTDVATASPHIITQRFVLPERRCAPEDPCAIDWIFDPEAAHSDFYDLRLLDEGDKVLWERTSPDRPEFVMLDTWDVTVGTERDLAQTVRLYYAALFPFAQSSQDLDHRLAPSQVIDFIEAQFVPIIRETWQTQFIDWGFAEPVRSDWDQDLVMEIFVTYPPFAISDGLGARTTLPVTLEPSATQPQMWWLSTHDVFEQYGSLAAGYRAVYSHEFFHIVQRNALISSGCSGDTWLYAVIEAQAMFAPSVQYPEMELIDDGVAANRSGFLSAANRFLGLRLNDSFAELNADSTDRYDVALFWRFLYDQYGDMHIVRAALEEMACGFNPDIVLGLPEVMDRAFEQTNGPFGSFEDSLVAFSRANYALRLENGRCGAPDSLDCAGLYYDPSEMYLSPPLDAELNFDGNTFTHRGSVPGSFGTDLIEVRLDSQTEDLPLTISLLPEENGTRFNLEIWELQSSGPGTIAANSFLARAPGDASPLVEAPPAHPLAVTSLPEKAGINQFGAHVYSIPQLNQDAYDRLALIITRLDTDEATDPVGAYNITFESK